MEDKFMSITQFVLACIMLACVIIEIVAHVVMGNITSILGYIVSLIFLLLSWSLFRISLNELHELNK